MLYKLFRLLLNGLCHDSETAADKAVIVCRTCLVKHKPGPSDTVQERNEVVQMIDPDDYDQFAESAWFYQQDAEKSFLVDNAQMIVGGKKSNMSKLRLIDQILADKKLEQYLASYCFENYLEQGDDPLPS